MVLLLVLQVLLPGLLPCMTCSLGLFFTLRLLMLSLLLLNFGLLVVESSTALGSRECFAPAGALL
jgi:hypothetical protein